MPLLPNLFLLWIHIILHLYHFCSTLHFKTSLSEFSIYKFYLWHYMESSVRSWCMIYLLSLIDSSMVLHTYFIRRDLLKVRNEFMSEVGVLLIWDIPVCNRKKKNLPIQNSENLDLSLFKWVILGSSLIYMCECVCVCVCVRVCACAHTHVCTHYSFVSPKLEVSARPSLRSSDATDSSVIQCCQRPVQTFSLSCGQSSLLYTPFFTFGRWPQFVLYHDIYMQE